MMVKYVGIRLEDADYRALDAMRADKRIKSIQNAVTEAIKEWSSTDPATSGPWASLNQTERDYLLAVLQYVREEPDGVLISTLNELVKRTRRRRRTGK
jgi:hypothetical protein